MLKTKSWSKSPLIVLGLVLATVFTAPPSKAATFTYQDDTTGKPFWRRTAPGNPPTFITGERDGNLGFSVPYTVFDFTVDTSGLYTIKSDSQPTPPVNRKWDNFLVLYQDSFDPTKQLTNVLIADTTRTGSIVTFDQELTAGRKYFLVTTGRRLNDSVKDFGFFTNTISGSGRTIPIPESDSIPAMLAIGSITLLLYKRKVGLKA
ncbi:PEP-CTERM sorting domain-containing protein [Nostoc sp. NIES-2111]